MVVAHLRARMMFVRLTKLNRDPVAIDVTQIRSFEPRLYYSGKVETQAVEIVLHDGQEFIVRELFDEVWDAITLPE